MPRLISGHLVVIGHPNGSVDYHGPFLNKRRATKYMRAAVSDYSDKHRIHIANLIVPFHSRVHVIEE